MQYNFEYSGNKTIGESMNTNMGRKSIFILLFIISTFYGFAQNDSSKFNSVFIEIGGAGGVYSINYAHAIFFSERYGLSTGIGFAPTLFNAEFTPRIPIQLKLFYKKRKSTIELGTALTPYLWYDNEENFSTNAKNINLTVFCELGYKYSILKNRCFVSIAFTPLIRDAGLFYFVPMGAFRFGYKF